LIVVGVFIIIQCMFIYLPFTYPRYSGSLFAANGFARSTFAAAAVLFAGPMFDRLGIDGGVSLLGGLTVLCIFGIYGMYFWGAALRRRSKFAEG
jgi:DHA1 family multidrug resistance protein-like MFS transporter